MNDATNIYLTAAFICHFSCLN